VIVRLLVADLPKILADPRSADPRSAGDPKSGPLRGCYGFTVSRGTGAAPARPGAWFTRFVRRWLSFSLSVSMMPRIAMPSAVSDALDFA